jgi:hypothetical protein
MYDSILAELEAKIGSSLNPLRDSLDLLQRQGDPKTRACLHALEDAWEIITVLRAMELRAQQEQATFSAIPDGGSVVDALFENAGVAFPRALAVTKRKQSMTPRQDACAHADALDALEQSEMNSVRQERDNLRLRIKAVDQEHVQITAEREKMVQAYTALEQARARPCLACGYTGHATGDVPECDPTEASNDEANREMDLHEGEDWGHK